MRYNLLFVVTFLCLGCTAQTNWYHLPNAPLSGSGTNPFMGRFTDMYFVDDSTGWIFGGDSNSIYKTSDAGNHWQLQKGRIPGSRSIEFLDANTGFAGTVSGQLHYTIDGGANWLLRHDAAFDSMQGICGMSHSGSSVFMCGAYNGDANFYRSADRGNTWSRIRLDSIAWMLIDCYFLNESVGFVSGRGPAGGRILKTHNGGLNWKVVATTGGGENYVWKIQFVSARTGYASIQNPIDTVHHFFKTTDGGETWVMHEMPGIRSFGFQGFWFANDTLGWMGGWTIGMYETRDAGATWRYLPVGANFNRFFSTPSGKLFAAGTSIFQYNPNHSTYFDTTGIPTDTIPREIVFHKLYPVFPNPTTGDITVAYDIGMATGVRLEVIDPAGKIVAIPIQQEQQPGHYELNISLNQFPNGVYTLVMLTHETHHSQKIILQR